MKSFYLEAFPKMEVEFDPYALPLSAVCRTPNKHFAELYAVTLGISKYADLLGWQPFFWTLTAPSEYHSNPSTGQCSYNNSTPFQANEWINSRFVNNRAFFAKKRLPLLGLRVVEVHKDGCPHWHLILFYPPDLAAEFKNVIEATFHGLIAQTTTGLANLRPNVTRVRRSGDCTRSRRQLIAKLSSQEPVDYRAIRTTHQAVQEIRRCLAGYEE